MVWRTQGSEKKFSTLFDGGKIVQHPAMAMENPIIVALTDRNDLDNQLHDIFSF